MREPVPGRWTTNVGKRLHSARYLLLASLLVLAVLAWLDPTRMSQIVVAAAFLVVVAALAPRRATGQTRTVLSGPPPSVWPDGSMRQFGDALDFPAYVIDTQGRIRFANVHSTRAFGRARIGEPASHFFRAPEFLRMFERALDAGTPQRIDYQEAAPPQRWFRAAMAPIGETPARFFLLSFNDLTAERLADQMRSDFVANASHELRTPLASLRGFIETIRGPAARDRKAMERFLPVMHEQAERMSRLIDDLLSLSRIEMKEHVPPQGTADLAKTIPAVAGAMTPLARQLGVELKTELPAAELPARADPDEIFQVCQNLVENACKYGQAGGRVEFGARLLRGDGEPPAVVEIFVRDFGPGIAEEHLPRLTERFYRVDVAASRQKQGTGLGLAIVKHILARHQTRLEIASRPGQGACFSFRLPLDPDKPN